MRHALLTSSPLVLAVLAGCAAAPGVQSGHATSALLERARAALGVGSSAADTAILVRGHIAGQGEDATFEHAYGPHGAFRRTRGALRPSRVGHDGESTWKQDARGAPRPLALGAAAEACFRAWLEGGAWASAELGAFGARAAEVDSGAGPALDLRALEGHFAGRVWLEPETALPTLFERDGPGAGRTRFADWRLVGERRVAFEIVHETAGGRATTYRVDSAEALDTPELALFRPEPGAGPDARFDPAQESRVPARLLATGHVLVQARLDGRPAGWFLLDTGAGRNLVHAGLTNELGWEPIGGALVAGTGGEVQARLLRSGRLDLGPVAIEGLPWVELDLEFLRAVLGVPVAGVLGYDVFARAVVEIDWALGDVALFDPALYPAPDAAWERLVFDDTAPCVRARFAPGNEGWFRLDTGSDDTVAFHTSTVRALGLGARIDGAREVRMEGVGGEALGRRGRIDWFELGGLRIHGPRVTLVDSGWGDLDDPYLAGNLGTGFLRGARVVLHYPARRVLIADLQRGESGARRRGIGAANVGTAPRIR